MATLTGGLAYIQAGSGVTTRKDLASVTLAQFDNAQGSNGTYINGVGKPDNSEVQLIMPYRTLQDSLVGPVNAHRGPGELLYISVNDTTAETFDYDGAITLELHEEIVNVQTGESRQATYQATDVFTTVTQGGIAAADVAMVVGQKIPIQALSALGPHEYGRLWGFAQFISAKV